MIGGEMPSRQALAGVKVLDLSTMLAGPFCATLLGEFGAEVVKIEIPGSGDPFRTFGTKTEGGATFNWLNEARNKKSVTLDLRTAKGLELAKRMVAESDIVVENFMPGTLERWGLGYEAMKAVNPRVILVRISAYGQTGPYNNRPGFARIAHAFSGLAHLAGEADGRPVMPGSTSLADYISGLYGAFGALTAYVAREQHGIGQYVDIGLYEGIFRMLDEMPSVYAKNGFVRQRMGPDTINIVPHSHYVTRDHKWVALSCSTDKMWERMTVAMERPDLMAPDNLAYMHQRLARREEVNAMVAQFIGNMDRSDLLELCMAHEIPIGPINDIADIFADPQFAARRNFVEVNDPRAGPVTTHNVFPVLSETPGRLKWLGPALGEHNREILVDRLGLTEVQLATLKQEGVI